jgi:hypothetical protein
VAQPEEEDELKIILKALYDVNQPKFVNEDIALFKVKFCCALVWSGLVWFGMVWSGLAWSALLCLAGCQYYECCFAECHYAQYCYDERG